ncbi:MAG TPA: DUF4954 family protein [Spirochaetota bacterium]|nr:DUF4954 family protein [Spirochaetota bacterium]
MAEKYKKVSQEQITVLKNNNCQAADWKKIMVSSAFEAASVRNCSFDGEVKIGALAGELKDGAGVKKKSSIYNAYLKDTLIGDNCRIANVSGCIADMNIGDNVLIENCGRIACTKENSFGNGHEIEVLNEGGGRELKITAKTSSQIAYLTVLYRENKKLIAALNKIADNHAAAVKAQQGTIGNNVIITDSKEIINVNINDNAVITGVSCLENGTIDSSAAAVTRVGHNVVAQDFIIQKGASVMDGAMVSATLIGEGVKMGKQFSAENSVFFANAEAFHSEACSLFAGPYSVTHHRSTLLIAALTSFYNAGSGTNQSNHMYKLGPLHQGILERGSKTGSFSYLLWPSVIGPFSAVIGKHYANFDVSDFPFSYITEEKGRSAIFPGMNFFTVGTLRDGAKWPQRDRRQNSDKLDQLIFDVLSPYTAQKMMRGSDIMTELYQSSAKGMEFVTYKGISIKRLLLKTCTRYYKLALQKYFGDVIVKRVNQKQPASLKEIFKNGTKDGSQWVDISGLLCKKNRLDNLLQKIAAGKVKNFNGLQQELVDIHSQYADDEWTWFLYAYEKNHGTPLAQESSANITALLDAWKKAAVKQINMVLTDAGKEFEGDVRIGFGIDGNCDADFEAVRGKFADNKFIKKLHSDLEEIENNYNRLIKLNK